MATGRSDNTMSDETFDHICTSCADDNLMKEGIKYCVECKGYCCTDCVSLHKTYRPLKRHNLLDISAQQDDQTVKLPSFPTEECSIHRGKVIDMYCADHDAVGCSACIAIDHKNCSNIHSIPDDIDTISKDEELDENVKHLQTRTEDLKSTLHQSNEVYLQKLDSAKEDSLLAISEHRKETDAILDRLEDNAKSEVYSKYDKLKSRLTNASKSVEVTLNTYVDFGDKIKQSKGNKSQKFVCSKLFGSAINKDFADMEKVKTELEEFSEDGILSFVGDGSLIESLQQHKQLGSVIVNEAKVTPYKLKKCHDINIKLQSDTTTCSAWGCCLFNDTTLLVTDKNNKKLKRINLTKLSVEDCVDLPYDIRAVCCSQNDEVVISCYDEKMLQFVSVGQTMTPSRRLKLKHMCFNVAYMDNKLYVSDNTGRSVHVYDMGGTLLQTICKDSGGKALFGCTVHIALCTSRDRMCVTDFRGGLVYLDKKGNYISTTIDPDIVGADGVCVDGRENVFVAGRSSNKVVQLGYGGKKRGVVLNEGDGIKTPHAICFQRKVRKMYVTMDNNDTVKVLDLELSFI